MDVVKTKYKPYISFFAIDETTCMDDGKFEGNIPIVERTGCDKTTFVQVKTDYLVTLSKYIGYEKIELSRVREENIRDWFSDQVVNFTYPNNVDELNDLIETYTQKKSNYIENDLGENMFLNMFAVMDNVSGLSQKPEEFVNFLTVSQKHRPTCAYIFHTIYPTRQN